MNKTQITLWTLWSIFNNTDYETRDRRKLKSPSRLAA